MLKTIIQCYGMGMLSANANYIHVNVCVLTYAYMRFVFNVLAYVSMHSCSHQCITIPMNPAGENKYSAYDNSINTRTHTRTQCAHVRAVLFNVVSLSLNPHVYC